MTSISATAQSPSKNYVQTKTFLDDAGATFLRHIDYYDGLGFVSETVDVGVNTSHTPVVARTEYDTRLKPSRQWAPVPGTGLDYVDNVCDDGIGRLVLQTVSPTRGEASEASARVGLERDWKN